MTENEIARVIVDAAYRVHTSLEPGLLEAVYQVVLAHELEKRGMRVERPASVRINYDGVSLDEAIGFPRLVMVISSFP